MDDMYRLLARSGTRAKNGNTLVGIGYEIQVDNEIAYLIYFSTNSYKG